MHKDKGNSRIQIEGGSWINGGYWIVTRGNTVRKS